MRWVWLTEQSGGGKILTEWSRMAEARQRFVYENTLKMCVFTTSGGYSNTTSGGYSTKTQVAKTCMSRCARMFPLTVEYTFIYDIPYKPCRSAG